MPGPVMSHPSQPHQAGPGPGNVVVQTLIAERGRFLGFLARRVGDPELAEDLLQTAILQAIRRSDTLRDEERVTAWIYRILRNVLADHGRRRAAGARAVERAAALDDAAAPEPELKNVVCACIGELLDTLPPQYADLLRLIEVDELAPAEAAGKLGISAGNARVRLHRARGALRERVEQMCRTCARHGCLDCTCGSTQHRV